jgi:hypothetical protein
MGSTEQGTSAEKLCKLHQTSSFPGARNELQGAEKFSSAAGCEEFYTHQAGQDT